MPQMADMKNRLAGISSLCKNCNEATHEGTFVDLAVKTGVKKLVVHVGAATGTPDSMSIVVTVRENTAGDSTGDTQMTDIDEESGVGVDQITVTAAGVYELHIENTKRYAAVSCAVDFTGGSSPAVPISAVFYGEEERF